jgi:hypothetical protein
MAKGLDLAFSKDGIIYQKFLEKSNLSQYALNPFSS